MKKFLTLSGAAVAALALQSFTPAYTAEGLQVVEGTSQVKEVHAVVPRVLPGAKRMARGISMGSVKGLDRPVRRIDSHVELPAPSMRAELPVAPGKTPGKSACRTGELPEGVSLSEGFDAWDGQTLPWYPQGWSLDSRTGTTGTEATTWHPSPANSMMGIEPIDGETMMEIIFNMDDPTALQDEWLVSPEITVKENELLTFYHYIDPLFLFGLDDFDWDNFDWVGERPIAYTLKVLAREAGSQQWVELWDATTKWLDVPALEMMYATPDGLQPQTVSLSSLEGKTVQLAFQYVGRNGNTLYLDAVSVGLPSLDGIVYDDPAETLYWGWAPDAGWSKLQVEIAQYPVYAPLTWVNQTYIDGASFQWEYCDPITAEWVPSDENDLTVTYLPDYSSETSTRNNWFYAPRLHASAPGATPGTYQAPYAYFQAGGKPERKLSDGSMFETGLVPFISDAHGYGIVTVEADFGKASTPIFGYNEDTDAYWLKYAMNGEEPGEGDHSHVEAILNYIYPSEGPLVISGANLMAVGKISQGVEFKAEILGLDVVVGGFTPQDIPLATATCTFDDVLVYERGMQDYLNVVFTFDKPVVVSAQDGPCMIRISGFHDPEHVQYFAPVQSMVPFTHGNVIAWLEKRQKINSDEERRSFSPLYRYESEYGMCHNAFAINLKAIHPWLVSEVSEIKLPEDGSAVTVPLDSYYDGSELTVTAPAGVTAAVTGRYGSALLTVSASSGAASGELSVKGTGVSKTFTVTANAGIEGIDADAPQGIPVAAYTVTGQQIDLDKAVNGLFLIRYSDESVVKTIVK